VRGERRGEDGDGEGGAVETRAGERDEALPGQAMGGGGVVGGGGVEGGMGGGRRGWREAAAWWEAAAWRGEWEEAGGMVGGGDGELNS
jgi:hypothetical protein